MGLQEERLELARQIAREAIVLLKNEGNVLPLGAGSRIAVFGQAQLDTIFSGGGSGQAHSDHPLQISEELAAAGLQPEKALLNWYRDRLQEKLAAKAAVSGDFDMSQLEGLVASGLIYELFGKYNAPEEEPVPPEEVLRTQADTAVLVIGRSSGGEECDRRVENDYYLLESELTLAKAVCAAYDSVILVLNVNGAVDLAWTQELPQIRAILFMGTAGEQGAGALADIITGKVSPSGKLSQTFALSYEDYPTAKNMSWNKDDPSNIKVYSDYGMSAEDNGSTGYDVSPVTVYEEDIYLGYRYFDSFRKPVLYSFGQGLSYASFDAETECASVEDGAVRLTVRVTNTSASFSGKQTVMVFLHAQASEGNLDRPLRELKAFEKTKELAPGESQVLELGIPIRELAVFDEEERAWVIEEGAYDLYITGDSDKAKCGARILIEEEIITARASEGSEQLGIREVNKDKLHLMKPEADSLGNADGFIEIPFVRTLTVRKEDLKPDPAWTGKTGDACSSDAKKFDDADHTDGEADKAAVAAAEEGDDVTKGSTHISLIDVVRGNASMEEFTAQMSIRELAVLCNGYGPGLPFGGVGVKDIPSTIQDEDGNDIGYNSHRSAFPGYENPAIAKYGIYSACYKDGPASVGGVAWPTDMMLGCTFNKELLYAFGKACGAEAVERDVDAWLAPAVNLIRNPVGGRDFEYFSEDPYLSGVCGAQIARGAMENNEVSVCPKHFALNEQETYRRGKTSRNTDAVDSIVSERAARELYLKPFEMIIKEAKPRVLMTSFNKINGTFAAGNAALCTAILRDEWGYDGVVVTDWGDMDAVVDGADAVEAGNDVVMPGGPPVIAQVLKGYEEGRVSRQSMEQAVVHLMHFVMHSKSFMDAAERESCI